MAVYAIGEKTKNEQALRLNGLDLPVTGLVYTQPNLDHQLVATTAHCHAPVQWRSSLELNVLVGNSIDDKLRFCNAFSAIPFSGTIFGLHFIRQGPLVTPLAPSL